MREKAFVIAFSKVIPYLQSYGDGYRAFSHLLMHKSLAFDIC